MSYTAPECLKVHIGILLRYLWLTYGGSPCPSLSGYIPDTIINNCNTLIQNENRYHTLLHDQISDLIDQPEPLPDSIPFGQAKELMVDPHQ